MNDYTKTICDILDYLDYARGLNYISEDTHDERRTLLLDTSFGEIAKVLDDEEAWLLVIITEAKMKLIDMGSKWLQQDLDNAMETN